MSCPTGFADCNGDGVDGCEAVLTADPDHCGACDSSCSSDGTVARRCDGGACSPVCDASHLDCNGDGADGCEVDVTEPDHCGSCTHVCGVLGTNARICAGGVCKPTCDGGHLDCNGDPDDGCETNILGDQDNCGACGHACSLAGATARSCVAGLCKPTCDGRSGDCTTPDATAADDGCETNLVTSVTSCGACGHDCLEGLCASSQCEPAELVSGRSLPGQLTVDSKYVHWLEGNVVVRTPTSGFGALPVVPGQDHSFSITSDGKYVYWMILNTASSAPFNGSIKRITSGQADVRPLASQVSPYGLAADGTNLYWIDAADSKIHQMDPMGTVDKAISPELGGPISLVTDGTSVFAGLAGTAIGIAKVPVGGGTLVQMSAQTTTLSIVPESLALDATHLYAWAYDSAARRTVLIQLPKTLAGDPITMASSTTDTPLAIAASTKFVYFAQPDGIYRIPVTGGASKFLAATNGLVVSLAVSNGAVYWIDPPGTSMTNGRVMKLAVFE